MCVFPKHYSYGNDTEPWMLPFKKKDDENDPACHSKPVLRETLFCQLPLARGIERFFDPAFLIAFHGGPGGSSGLPGRGDL